MSGVFRNAGENEKLAPLRIPRVPETRSPVHETLI
jgi:hypothetical protein